MAVKKVSTMVKSEDETFLLEWMELLNKKIDGLAEEHRTVALVVTKALTVKDNKGIYRKITKSSGEVYRLVSAYTGKKGDLIFVFTPTTPESFRFMEMKFDEAVENLGGFRSTANQLVAQVSQELRSVNVLGKTVAIPEVSDYSNNPLWGAF